MNRRTFFFLGLGLMAGKFIEYSGLYIPKRQPIWIPTEKQLEFLEHEDIQLSLSRGMLYYKNNATVGTWSGFSRA